jgi:hypothetical protein
MVLLLSILVSDLFYTSKKFLITHRNPLISHVGLLSQLFALLTLVIWFQKENFKQQSE